MRLIADSGSTKTAWCVVKEGVCTQTLYTAGINPYYMEPVQIKAELQSLRTSLTDEIEHIYFYGAGVASSKMSRLLEQCLHETFTGSTAEAHTDLLGAARALCQRESGMVGILGTGSNSCFYNGVEIEDNVPPCGFILGDEGSGAALGKRLVADFLKRRLPAIIHKTFLEETKLTKEEILERVYRQPFPNRFLASFSLFLEGHQSHEYVHELLHQSFDSFFTHNIMQYNYKQYPLHLLGSVAFCFQGTIKEVAAQHHITIGKIEKIALPELIQYHNTK